jgi:hypothetical protein
MAWYLSYCDLQRLLKFSQIEKFAHNFIFGANLML